MSMEDHERDYIENVWKNYSKEEILWWIHLLAKRATHRKSMTKVAKDLSDAKNYIEMLEKWLEIEEERK